VVWGGGCCCSNPRRSRQSIKGRRAIRAALHRRELRLNGVLLDGRPNLYRWEVRRGKGSEGPSPEIAEGSCVPRGRLVFQNDKFKKKKKKRKTPHAKLIKNKTACSVQRVGAAANSPAGPGLSSPERNEREVAGGQAGATSKKENAMGAPPAPLRDQAPIALFCLLNEIPTKKPLGERAGKSGGKKTALRWARHVTRF